MKEVSVTPEITVKRLIRFQQEGAVKAVCDVALGDQILIRGLRVVESRQGLFVSMPRQQGKNGKWYDIATPLSRDAKDTITSVVLEAYNQEQKSQDA